MASSEPGTPRTTWDKEVGWRRAPVDVAEDPGTEAGRELDRRLGFTDMRTAILAIEAEAIASERARVREAVEDIDGRYLARADVLAIVDARPDHR